MRLLTCGSLPHRRGVLILRDKSETVATAAVAPCNWSTHSPNHLSECSAAQKCSCQVASGGGGTECEWGAKQREERELLFMNGSRGSVQREALCFFARLVEFETISHETYQLILED